MVETTSSEFVDWLEFKQLNMNNPSRSDYYLAQIAAEMQRTIAKHPQKIRLTDFLLKFTPKKKEKAPVTAEEIQQRTMASKAAWFAFLKRPSKAPEGGK